MDKVNSKKPLILVAYLSTGSGHQCAAEAVVSAIKQKNQDVEVKLVDALDYFAGNITGNTFVSATSGFLAPAFDVAWRKNFTGRILWGGGRLWPSSPYRAFEDYITIENPDVVVATHFVCANAAAKARIFMDKKFSIVCIPTDYETEGMWPHKETDLFCVATPEMKSTLLARKVAEENIMISGIPVDLAFTQQRDKAEARERFGFPQDKKLAIVLAGANLPGPYKNIRRTLKGCFKYFAAMNWMHFVICVGRDKEYEKKIRQRINKYKASNITIMTYISNLSDLFTAADIALIKPGGLATTECACVGLPMLLIGKTYAQEDINRRYLTAVRAAEHATTYPGVINLLCDIFTDEEYYNTLKMNASKICGTMASNQIANAALGLLYKPHTESSNIKTSIYIGNTPVHTR